MAVGDTRASRGHHDDVGHGGGTGERELEKLAAELNHGGYAAHVVMPPGRRPYVYVRNQRAGMLTENIYAGEGWYWFGWAERIAPVADVLAAALVVRRVLGSAER